MLAWDSTTVQSGLYIVLVSILRSSSAWDAVLLEGLIVAPLTSSPIRADYYGALAISRGVSWGMGWDRSAGVLPHARSARC